MKSFQAFIKMLTFFKSGISICLFLLGMGPALAAADWSIEHAEQARISAPVQAASAAGKSGTMSLTVSAFNKTFSLQLKTNERLVNSINNLTIPSGVILYAGTVEGNPDSWVRLTHINGSYAGAIYDGSELFFIDAGANASSALGQALKSAVSGPVMYRASDIKSSMTCGLEGHSVEQFSYKAFIKDLKISASTATANAPALASGTLNEIKMDIVADTEYSNRVSGDSRTAILSQMNVVDGIFVEQVGVKVAINGIDVLSSNGPLTSNRSESLLGAFRDYAGRSHPGLAHLFTGKDLDGGGTLGIAYLDAICSDWGVGVSQAGGRGVGGALTVAHEIGHNFGAPHDNQGGSPCDHVSNQYLMNPYYNQSDQFSQCSITQMDRMIERASCMRVINDDGTGGDGGDGGTGGDTDALTTPKSTYTLGESVVIEYHRGSGSSQDWIGIFKQGDLTSSCSQNDSYVDWVYTNGRSGSASFSGLAAGEYEAQLFLNDGYCYIGSSIRFSVTGTDDGPQNTLTTTKSAYTLGETVTIEYHEGSGSSLDWVGIFKQGDLTRSCDQNDSYVDWKYTNGRSGTLSFSGLAVGNYAAQLFSDDGYCYIGSSLQFSVTTGGDGGDGGDGTDDDGDGTDDGGDDTGDTDVPDSNLPFTGLKDSAGLCLTVDSSRTPMRTKVAACSFALSDANQKWRLTEAGYLQSGSTGLCLTPGDLATPGTAYLAQCTTSRWFNWTHQNGVLTNARNPNYALTSPSTAGSPVAFAGVSGADNQKWQFGGALGMGLSGLVMLMLVRLRRRGYSLLRGF